jgi:hypothetical protein
MDTTIELIKDALAAVAGERPWRWDLFPRLMSERSPVHPRRSSFYDFCCLHDATVTGVVTEDAILVARAWLPGET